MRYVLTHGLMLCLAVLAAGCDRQASRLATEHGSRWARSYYDMLEYCNSAIELDPNNALAYARRGFARTRVGPYHLAVEDLKRAIELDPDGLYPMETYNGLAWLRATCTEDELRDGKEAVELAKKACEFSHWQDPNIIDTLAAAYAEAGDFDKAIHWQQQAIEMQERSEDRVSRQLRHEFQSRLHRYREHVPYRE